MNSAQLNAGSYRDPAGQIYECDGHIYRAIYQHGSPAYQATRDSGVVRKAIDAGFLVDCTELPTESWPAGLASASHVVEHPRLPYISYPYEWSFSQLKAAALHHLSFQLMLLEQGFKLTDASAYNIQFLGVQPIFIDLLSISPYTEGEFWLGHRQFCEQFLNPLLLRSELGIAHNAWYRGALEGIPSASLCNLLPIQKKLSWKIFSHIVLPTRLERQASSSPEQAIAQVKSNGKFSRLAYSGFLTQLKNWISGLHPLDTGKTTWADYARVNTYSDHEKNLKKKFVADFIARALPNSVIDLGCNTGDYSMIALEAGAGRVTGFDFDQHALDYAYSRCHAGAADKTRFLPLWLDASNPSPDQGWQQRERGGFQSRSRADALLALAFEHHLAIARNIPLVQVIEWLLSLAPQGVIEFVPKADSTVQRMLALREDIFDTYTLENFESILAARADITAKQEISTHGRVLFCYHVR
ncbi:MAG: class I SAM-dependent methyltransferase [Pseudomonadota bacterium]